MLNSKDSTKCYSGEIEKHTRGNLKQRREKRCLNMEKIATDDEVKKLK